MLFKLELFDCAFLTKILHLTKKANENFDSLLFEQRNSEILTDFGQINLEILKFSFMAKEPKKFGNMNKIYFLPKKI